MSKVTRRDLSRRAARKVGLNRDLAEQLVMAFIDEIKFALAKGEVLEFRGFGTLKVITVKAMTRRSISTGEPTKYPPVRRAHFKPGRDLTELINETE